MTSALSFKTPRLTYSLTFSLYSESCGLSHRCRVPFS